MFSHQNYQVFICYRRKEDGGAPLGSYIARILYDYLSKSGINTFYDVECFNIGEDYIETTPRIIREQIRFFIVILTPDIFKRCKYENEDPVYRELTIAIDKYSDEREPTNFLPVSNKFQFYTINPDNLFDYKTNLPKTLNSEIRNRVSANTACEINFTKRAFKDDIDRDLLKPIINVLQTIQTDSFNKLPHGDTQEDFFVHARFAVKKREVTIVSIIKEIFQRIK